MGRQPNVISIIFCEFGKADVKDGCRDKSTKYINIIFRSTLVEGKLSKTCLTNQILVHIITVHIPLLVNIPFTDKNLIKI